MTSMSRITENKIQLALYYRLYFEGWRYFLPNVRFFDWESDYLAFNDKGQVFEYEIKTNVSDFHNDFKKRKHLYMNARHLSNKPVPNRFYFAVPFGMVKAKDVPDYAGLIWIREGKTRMICKFMKHGPDLSQTRCGEGDLRYLVEKSNEKMIALWLQQNGSK
jgi:hypothetical protein